MATASDSEAAVGDVPKTARNRRLRKRGNLGPIFSMPSTYVAAGGFKPGQQVKWYYRSRRTLMRVLIMLGLLASASFAQPEPEIRQTAARALPMLERSAANFVAKRACISCHHNFLPILAFHLARDRGISVNSTVLNA